jgi:GTP diphosphokinase / guanosine-3',5'-bis(diphosphate) 3'-diphosphatase
MLNAYNQTFLSRQDLIARILTNLDPVDLNLVVSAYDMADNIHEFQKRLDGTPYFWHVTRTAKILIEELKIYEPEIISATLLHDALEDSDILTPDILTFNFGPYISYLVETLTKNFKLKDENKIKENIDYLEKIKHSSIDCIIIKLAERLDNFRCLEFGIKESPIKYIEETFSNYIPIAEKFKDESIITLIKLIKIERNKLLN